MQFKLQYQGEEARRAIPRIASFVDTHWKNVKFPKEGGIMIGKWNYLSPTDTKSEEREYNLFFIKNSMFGEDHHTKISFNTLDINEISTNSSSEKIPTQIIIKLRNNTSIWISGGKRELVDVYLNTEGK